MKRIRKLLIWTSLIFLLIPATVFATSWVYAFVVWDEHIYQMTDEEVMTVKQMIGKVTHYSDMEPKGGNFSNYYPRGTKYYAIEGIDPKLAMAVEVAPNSYLKAVNDGKYTSPTYERRKLSFGFAIFAGVIAAITLLPKLRNYSTIRKALKRPFSSERHWRVRLESKRSTTFDGGTEMTEELAL